jgi:hypothetical protein
MSRKTPEEHFQDYVDSAVISLVMPLPFAALYQAFQSVPIERLGLASKIFVGMMALMLLILFLSGMAGSMLRGGFFGGIGYLIGNYGTNLLVTDPIVSILIMAFGALVTYIGTSTRTRTEFQNEVTRAVDGLGI